MRRGAVVALHLDGWSAKAICGYLRAGTSTVWRILGRWAEEEPAGPAFLPSPATDIR